MTLAAALVAAVFAAHRGARAVTADSITDGVRTWARDTWAVRPGLGEWQLVVRDKLAGEGGLIDCPHCMGFWLSGVATLVAIRGTGTVQSVWLSLMEWWAVAGAQSFLSSWQADLEASEDDAADS